MKLKTMIYNATLVLPVIEKIYKCVKFIINFNQTNLEILQARDEIVQNVRYLQNVVYEISEFHNLNSLDDGD